MSSKMDGVKISINHDIDESTPKKKKTLKRKPVNKNISKQIASNTSNQNTRAKNVQTGGLLSSIITFIVTAALVGGGIYAWQNKTLEKSVNQIQEDARSTRIDFEKRLENLKNTLTGVETENEELKTKKEELEARVKLLDGAKKDFFNSDIGLSFAYPALFGDVNIKFDEVGSSTKFLGTFSEVDTFSFGGVSTDYELMSTSSPVSLFESQGYYERSNKYYFIPPGSPNNQDYEIIPTKIIKVKSNREALIIDKNSFVEEADDEERSEIQIGENMGALVNLDNENYLGIAFINSDFGVMPPESFESLLKTIEIE